MTRTPLPLRRQSRFVTITHDGRSYQICVGYDFAGQPRELFADGSKAGSGLQALISDACVLASIALQYGATAAELQHSMGHAPAFHEGREVEGPASLIGAALSVLAPLQDFDASREIDA